MDVRAVSADSHVLEPADLWVQRLGPKFRDRAPYVEKAEDGENYLHVEGREPREVRPLGTPAAMYGKQVEEGRRGGWDPNARLEDMAIDGVEAEVVYPSLGMFAMSIPDAGLQAACYRAYNDWVAEFCSAHPKKLYGVALIPVTDKASAVKEAKRSAAMGLRGAMIWGTPMDDRYSFASGWYDPIWTELEALGMPISLHSFTGKVQNWAPEAFLHTYSHNTELIPRSITQMMFSGTFDRFPDLKVISVENDIGWVGFLMQRMDWVYQRKAPRLGLEFGKSGLLPSEYFDRNVRCTFMADAVGMATLDLIGPNIPMWSTDYPHNDSTWPESRKSLEEQFADIDPGVRERVVFRNAVGLYGMDV